MTEKRPHHKLQFRMASILSTDGFPCRPTTKFLPGVNSFVDSTIQIHRGTPKRRASAKDAICRGFFVFGRSSRRLLISDSLRPADLPIYVARVSAAPFASRLTQKCIQRDCHNGAVAYLLVVV